MKIPIARPLIGREEMDAVQEIMKSGILAHGPRVEEFEEAFAHYVGTKYAVAVNSGTAALHLALLAHGIGPGDEVITTPFTFIATANAIRFTGAKPVFADIEPRFAHLDPLETARAITSHTRAIIPVHLFGRVCSMEPFLSLAKEYQLIIIEDACQAHGAAYGEIKAGAFGTGCFSFYPTKNMTTGEGGMVTTNDPELASRLRMLRNHGQEKRYYHTMPGLNYRMTSIAAVIGLIQLSRLDEFNQARIEHARQLNQGLGNIVGLVLPPIKPDALHVFHQYTVKVTSEFGISRDELRHLLQSRGIGTEVYYPLPLNRQPCYQGQYGEFPIAASLSEQVLSLPVHPSVTHEEINYIIDTISAIKANGEG